MNLFYFQIIEKGSCYHTLQQSWLGMIKESERLADVHQHVGKDLLKEDLDKVGTKIGLYSSFIDPDFQV